jgi:Putative Ig domain
VRKSVLLLATALVAVLVGVPVAGAQTPEEESELTNLSIDTDQVTDRVGLVDPTTGRWNLRMVGGAINSFFYGNPGDFPIAGDWNCDGIDTPGLYRQSDGFVYLRNSNTQGIADIRFFFGNPGDIPLAGDFNDDGCDTISIYRPSESRIYIINKLGANDGGLGAADFNYIFGNPGDKPFVGDFNGDGIDTIGLHRESTGFVYFRQSHTQGIANAEFFFGDPGDRLVAGDWGIVNDVDTPAIFRPSVSRFFFRYTNTQGIANEVLQMGEFRMLPVAGAWTIKLGLGGSLPKAVVGIPFARTLSPVGGTPPYTVTKTSGPPWLSVNNAGRVAGNPPSVGNFTLGVTVTDSLGKTANQTIPLTVQDGCDTNNQIPNAQCLALVDLYRKTNGNGWIERTNWFVTPPCSWFGVLCGGGQVTEIVLEGTAGNGNNLNGTITTQIGALTGLQVLNLQHNSLLTGPIPSQISTMTALQVFDLSGTNVSGPIPNSFGAMAALREVEIDETAVTGGIPASLLNRAQLVTLDLANNSLTFGGALPNLGNLDALQVLDLSDNAFTGDIATGNLTGLASIQELNVSTNQLTGSVPAFGAPTPLIELDLAGNLLTGPVPTSIDTLVTLPAESGSLTLCPNTVTVDPIADPNLNNFINVRDAAWNEVTGTC